MKVKISFVVPVYNTEKFLEKCLISLINQSLKSIEIIVINDGSTDDSEKIIKNINDSKIKYFKQKNKGIGYSRNLGIQNAKGEYISFIDSDDYVDINFAEKMYNKAIETNSDLVICDYYEDNNEILTKRIIPSFDPSSLKNNPKLLNLINLGPCNKIYRSNLIKDIKFAENLKYEDVPFVCSSMLKAEKICKLNEFLTYYFIHNYSQTTTRDTNIFDIFKIIELIINEFISKKYMKQELTNLVVRILTDYTIQLRYIKSSKLRITFIDEAFKILNELDENWPKCYYLKKFPYFKRIVKRNKFLTKLYCCVYNRLMIRSD